MPTVIFYETHMIGREGSPPREVQATKAERCLKVGMILVGMMAPASGEAGPSRSPDNAWAQLMGTNVEERTREIDRLESRRAGLEGQIAGIEQRLQAGGARYERDSSVRDRDEEALRQKREELARVQEAVDNLQEGIEEGVARETERRARRMDGRLDPTLDLSAAEIGNPDISDYFGQNRVGFSDHRLSFDLNDGTPDGARLAMVIGPEFTDADFYFKDGRKDLWIVFTRVEGTHFTLILNDGYFGGAYESRADGKPVPAVTE